MSIFPYLYVGKLNKTCYHYQWQVYIKHHYQHLYLANINDRWLKVMSKKEAYQVLLYYQYVDIDDPEEFAADHLEFCKELELKGRIIVAHEGINGTVSGTVEQTEKYMQTMNNDPRFADMAFKVDKHDGHAF